MPEDQKTKRKLSAILSADVKGYSILMADDEIHTIETLKAYLQRKQGYQAPEILPVCDYNHNRLNLALVHLSMIPW